MRISIYPMISSARLIRHFVFVPTSTFILPLSQSHSLTHSPSPSPSPSHTTLTSLIISQVKSSQVSPSMAAVVAAVEAGIVPVGGGGSGKRRGCGFYWRLRAEIMRQVGRGIRGSRRQKLSFHYDPFSYALNFDDGSAASAFLI